LSIEKLSDFQERELQRSSAKSSDDLKSVKTSNNNISATTSSVSIANRVSIPNLHSSSTDFDDDNNNNPRKSNMSTTSNSSSQLNSSDDIDYNMNTNSATLAMELEAKSTTLRFNKYGFIQQDYLANTLINGDTMSKRSSVNQNSIKKDSTHDGQIYAANSVQSLATDKSLSTNGDASSNTNNNTNRKKASKNRMEITNLKDYIQNADVEEFSEDLPIDVIRARESKWLDMLGNFNEWMEKRFKKIKSRCRKGIPQSMRGEAWMHLTGAFLLKNQRPNYYQDCLQNNKKIEINKYLEDIKKDLHRQFPNHEIFMRKEGRQSLFNVLKAYAVHNKEVGYCQAQGPIAALLLMHMLEEDAFWMLVRISDFYLEGYFKPGLEKVQIDGQALFFLFKKENKVAFKLMKSQGVDPVLFMTEWFMCVFARTLPWCTVLRVWDMFFCEGVKVLYRIGLHLMLSAFSDKQKFERCQSHGLYETLNLLKNLPLECLKEKTLVIQSSEIKFNEEDLKKAYDKSSKEFRRQNDELNKNRKEYKKSSNIK